MLGQARPGEGGRKRRVRGQGGLRRRRVVYPRLGRSSRSRREGASSGGRWASLTQASKLKSQGGRRDSDASLLGFELAQRRRSNTRRSNRRRSSAFSNVSFQLDPVEDARLRNVSRMDGLPRRSSKVVEVTCPSDSESAEDDTAVARAAVSRWSPYSSAEEDDDDDSEILTTPYFPTPELPPSVPSVLSNFPLSSVAQEHQLNAPSDDLSSGPSPVIPARLVQPTNQRFISTPPLPASPSFILRDRVRPRFPRASSQYESPPRSDGVPAGAALPRPVLSRSISTPLFSAATKPQEAAMRVEKRLIGAFPIARAVPLGISPLRASLRRQSIMSDSDTSRRGSIANRRASQKTTGSRRSSVTADRRESLANRRESLADRRLSIVRDGPVARRISSNLSLTTNFSASLKSSTSSLRPRKNSLASMAPRKSSVVSISEFGYLAPHIVVDAPPAPALIPEPQGLSTRRNAPTNLILPMRNFNFPATAPNTPYSPLESFLGRSNPSTPMPLSPSMIWTRRR